MAAALGELTAAESQAVLRYQATDRIYELVSEVLRGSVAYDDLDHDQSEVVAQMIATLDGLTTMWRLPEAVVAYRGQRSLDRTFGPPPPTGREYEIDSFLSASIHRHVAIDEFTEPPGPGGAVLLEILAPAGTPALWVPPVGDPALEYQGELLLPRRTRICVGAVDTVAGILTVSCEVLLP